MYPRSGSEASKLEGCEGRHMGQGGRFPHALTDGCRRSSISDYHPASHTPRLGHIRHSHHGASRRPGGSMSQSRLYGALGTLALALLAACSDATQPTTVPPLLTADLAMGA